jgi:hypothetical protein
MQVNRKHVRIFECKDERHHILPGVSPSPRSELTGWPTTGYDPTIWSPSESLATPLNGLNPLWSHVAFCTGTLSLSVSLPREWIHEIKCMTTVYFRHGLFLTCTQKSNLYLQVM